MNDFNRCNKVSGVRWLKRPVEDIKIRIKLKPRDGVLSLPKFEDYTNNSNHANIKQQLEVKIEEHNFGWQEKVFSQWEIQRYSDVHSCLSETELNYNEMLNNGNFESSKIFTYIHEDFHIPLPGNLKTTKTNLDCMDLNSCLERLNLNDKVGRIAEDSSSLMGHLFRSEENIAEEKEQWKAMHIVYDSSEYNEDSQLLLKQESLLLSLFYNTQDRYLIISPDVNDIVLNPYSVESSGVQLGYVYGVDVGFEKGEVGEELMVLLKKLHKKWERKQKQILKFTMPPLGRKYYYISLEILKARDFEGDNMYIEFTVKLPENITCDNDNHHGRTHKNSALKDDNVKEWHFGHILEFNLEASISTDPAPLKLFFEVISTDWWGRHRTEGYTYLPLTLTPGYYSKQLYCSRPDELDEVEAANRRFFVGGCHLIKNLDVLAMPHLQDANFKYVTTGTISLRWNVISQAPLPGSTSGLSLPSASSASALLLGAEAVLRHYKRARARLAAATEGLARGDAKEEETSD